MTRNKLSSARAAYAKAARALELFESDHPVSGIFLEALVNMRSVVAYALQQTGQLAGCRGVCLSHWMADANWSSRGLVHLRVPDCSEVAVCCAAQELREGVRLLAQWEELRLRLCHAKQQLAEKTTVGDGG